jgi:hypothetical protein
VTAKQLAKLLAIMVVAFGICFGLLFLTDGYAALVFDKILTSFLIVITLLVTISILLYAQVDNISKELVDIRNEVNRELLNILIVKLSSLKREILYNIGLAIALLVLELSTSGVSVYLNIYYKDEIQVLINNTSLSLQFSLFCVLLLVVIIQLKGFIITTEYRDIITKNRI